MKLVPESKYELSGLEVFILLWVMGLGVLVGYGVGVTFGCT